MRDYKLGLVAGVPQRIKKANSTAYHVIISDTNVTIKLDDGIERVRSQGLGEFGLDPFETLEIVSSVDQNVTIGVGDGAIVDSRATATGTFNVTEAPQNEVEALAPITVGAGLTVQLVGADATRGEVRIGVDSNQAGGVYIGHSGVNITNKGGFMEIGSVDYLQTTAGVYAYNPNGVSVVVNLMEVRKV